MPTNAAATTKQSVTLDITALLQVLIPVGVLTTQVQNDYILTCSSGVFSDDVYRISAGAVDAPLTAIATPVNFLAMFPTEDILVKLNSSTEEAIPVRSGGCFILDGMVIADIFITNVALVPVNIRAILALRD